MNSPVLDIACLCAAWCGTCGAYAQVFQELERAWPGHRFRWIDIEDEAELVGDFDVETFPTLVVADAERVRFAGPLTPQPETLLRVLHATLANAAGPGQPDAAVNAFAERLRAL